MNKHIQESPVLIGYGAYLAAKAANNYMNKRNIATKFRSNIKNKAIKASKTVSNAVGKKLTNYAQTK